MVFHSIIMARIGDREIAKERFDDAIRLVKIYDVNVNHVVFFKIS